MKRYILTIDVGIKNLALCLIKYDDNQIINKNKEIIDENKEINKDIIKNINIFDWRIIDVSIKTLRCEQIKNKRAICKCSCTHYKVLDETKPHTDEKNIIGYCKSHSRIEKSKKTKLYKISENPLYKNSFQDRMSKLVNGLINYTENIINKNYDYNVKLNKFDKIENLEIYIENQPVLKNPVMKSVANGIYFHFLTQKIINPRLIKTVENINATCKTKISFINYLSTIGYNYNGQIENYNDRKMFSEYIIKQIIQNIMNYNKFVNNIVNISNYNLTKKKDDMADTLLYVIYVLSNVK